MLMNKKGTLNDTGIMVGIVLIFIAVGAALPFIQTSFAAREGGVVISNNYSIDVVTGVAQAGENATSCGPADVNGLWQIWCRAREQSQTVQFIEVMASIATIFFWTFGALPLWLDLIFVILRVTLAFILIRTIRGVG